MANVIGRQMGQCDGDAHFQIWKRDNPTLRHVGQTMQRKLSALGWHTADQVESMVEENLPHFESFCFREGDWMARVTGVEISLRLESPDDMGMDILHGNPPDS